MFNRRLRRKIRIGAHSAADNRPKIIKTVIICVAVIAAVIILTVMLGNHLKKQAEKIDDLPATSDTPSKSDTDEQSPTSQYDALSVPVIQGEYVTLSSSAGIDWSERATSLKMANTTAVSLILYYGDSVVNYSSRVAQQMAYQSAANTKTDLYEAASLMRVADIYTAGCFYATFHEKLTLDIINIYRAYEAALIAEAVDAGLDEITVFGFGCDELGYVFAEQLFGAVRELDPAAKLGIAISGDVIELGERAMLFGNYASVADYLALDLSFLSTADELSAALTDAMSLINKYSVRIIVSNTLDGAEQILTEAGIVNWQKVPD